MMATPTKARIATTGPEFQRLLNSGAAILAITAINSPAAAAAAGLLAAVIARMIAPLFTKRWNSGVLVAVLAFVGVAIMHWPLPYVFLALAPFSIAAAWFKL